MLRLVTLLAIFALPACAGPPEPVSSPSMQWQSPQGVTGTRLRCGSESLRTRIRDGNIVVERVGRPTTVLRPLAENGAAGSAYGDGSLTLYRLPDRDGWALKTTGGAKDAHCRADPAGNQGTGKSDIPAR